MRLRFHKYHGLGNDFALIDARQTVPDLRGEPARLLCDRHRGIGADGLLLWTGSVQAPRMQVINADGSVPEMCGNGIRCFAKHIGDLFATNAAFLDIETGAGLLRCGLHRAADAQVEAVTVAMGRATLDAASVPIARREPLLAGTLDGVEPSLRWTAVGIGNPHVITLDPVQGARRAELGPLLSHHRDFPNATNVEFVQVLDPGADGAPRMRVDVYERGCGWTQACGTGATAAAFAAVQLGAMPAGRAIAVQLPGGWLEISVATDGATTMRGPAVLVYQGEIELESLAD